uniref:Phospholipase/carboxylesterase/thioesterase domain-containing protein n=1 Tax=Calcidiscus leptoporus TaxID=127549 RepID=A0A7S0NZ60_9EUKA
MVPMSTCDVSTLSVKELKALIAEAGLSTAGCVEKADLRARAAEAQAKLVADKAATGESASAPAWSQSERTLSGFSCLISAPADVAAGSAPADLAVILLHGLGAGNRDLADLTKTLSSFGLASRKILFVFPQAPAHPMFGSAWWSIDPMKFMALSSADSDAVAKAIREEPPDLSACRAKMATLVQEVRTLGGGTAGMLPTSRVLLGGFSQGAITSLDVALQCADDEHVAGVLFLSGAPIVVEQWAARLKLHRGLRVLMTHGQADMTLPVVASGWVRDLLGQHGASVSYKLHTGGHDLGDAAILSAIAAFIRDSIPVA